MSYTDSDVSDSDGSDGSDGDSENEQRYIGTSAGLGFDASMARNIGDMRDRRFTDTYDKILMRCLKQIEVECVTKKSTIFVVPSRLCTELLAYRAEDVVEYLVIALGKDRDYTVIKVCGDTIYIRWTPPQPPGVQNTPSSIIQRPERPERPKLQERPERPDDVSMAAPMRTILRKKTANVGKTAAKKKTVGNTKVDARQAMADINKIVASVSQGRSRH